MPDHRTSASDAVCTGPSACLGCADCTGPCRAILELDLLPDIVTRGRDR